MQVTTAMLADAATVADGKLYIQGGGWNSMLAQQMPVVHPGLAVVLMFELGWHEGNEDLKYAIELLDEDGKPAGLRGEANLRVSPLPFVKKGSDLYQCSAHMLYGVRFEKYGIYRFQITCGDQVLASVPLTIIASPIQIAAPVA
jgi:hypothetical protein